MPHPIQTVLSGLHLDDLDAILDHALFGEPLQEAEAEEVTAEVETRPEAPPVAPPPAVSPPAAVVAPSRAPTPAPVPRRHTRRLSVLPSLVAEEEAWLRRMQEERSRQQARAELLASMPPPPPEPVVVVPAPVPVRLHRLPMVVGLLGPVTLGLALGAILMRLVVQPESSRALEAPRQGVASLKVAPVPSPPPPVTGVSVAPVIVSPPVPSPEPKAPSVPVSSPSEAERAPPVIALPLVKTAPEAPVSASASVSVAPGVLPATHAAIPAPLRHKREPRPLPSPGEAHPSGTLSDREFDRAMGFVHAPATPASPRGGARAHASVGDSN